MDFAAYIVFKGFVWFVNLLPLHASLGLGSLIGSVAFRLGGKRRRRVVESILRAFGGDKSEEEATAIAASMYRNLGMSLVEFARFSRLDEGYVERYVSFDGLERIDTALEKGKGVVLLAAHFGNWELLSAALALKGYRLSAVARPLDNRYINACTEGFRTAFGNEIIEKKNALRKMMELLRRNGILGILLDQRSSRKEGVMVRFFNIPAPTSKGLAAVVAKTGSEVLPVYIHRVEGPRHRVVCSPPIELVRSGDRQSDIRENTQRFTAAIEEFIRRHPDQWFWFHSRWERRRKKA